jgi:ParB/RepB/Spo0J family partition protein
MAIAIQVDKTAVDPVDVDRVREKIIELWDRHCSGEQRLNKAAAGFCGRVYEGTVDLVGRAWDQALDLLDLLETQKSNSESADDKPAPSRAVSQETPSSSLAGLRVVELPMDKVHRRPSNRGGVAVTFLEVADLVASIESFGLSTPIEVRPASEEQSLPVGHYELTKGERRWTAYRAMNRDTIPAIVRDLDAAAAAIAVGVDNTHRKDLDPIQRAQAIRDAIAHGVSPADAGKAHGLTSDSGVTNALRLLELPPKVQSLVSSGGLPAKAARYLVPFAGLPAVMEEAVSAVKRDCYWTRPGVHESQIKRGVEQIVLERTRPADKRPHEYGYELGYNHPCYFELTDSLRAKLQVTEVRIDNKPCLVAQNVKAYDALQIPLIKKKLSDQKTNGARKQTAADRVPRAKSPAEQKREAAERAARLKQRREIWLHDLRRRWIADRMDTNDRHLQTFLTWVSIADLDHFVTYSDDRPSCLFAVEAGIEPRKISRQSTRDEKWAWVAAIDKRALYGSPQRSRELDEVAVRFAKALLTREDKDPKQPLLPHAVVADLAHDYGLDMDAVWSELQRMPAGQGGNLQRADVEAFFLLHERQQLAELAAELGVYVTDKLTRSGIVKLLMNQDRTLKLPKCLGSGEARAKSREPKKAKAGKGPGIFGTGPDSDEVA